MIRLKETKIYRTAMYLRLSKGDLDVDGMEKSESNSITNQRMIVESFLKKNPDLKLVDTYIDDGYTGTNFDRPEMKRMMADVDAGRIDCIVVKDLSRFGRERIETGTYIAKTFKAKGIRFIAINDHYDTLTADGSETHIVMPIKALTNDNFSRDISTKVRSSQGIKREKGEYIGAFAPYGYKKSVENKNLLVPDDYAADIVRDIFAKKLAGMSANAIADELNATGILSPAEYKRKQGQKYSTSFLSGKKSRWSAQTVIRILKDEVYTGNLAQGKRVRVSYKVRKEIQVPREDWIRCENTHKPIIKQTDFDAVQMLMDRDTIKADASKKSYIYSGILYCGDCGNSMVRRSNYWKKDGCSCYICSGYNRRGDCSRHLISEEDLDEAIRLHLQEYVASLSNAAAIAKSIEFLETGYEEAQTHDSEIQKLKEELVKCSSLKSSLYQDLKEGLINESQFNRYREEYTNREMMLKAAIEEQESLLKAIYENGIATELQLTEIKKNLNISGLDRLTLVTFVDKILVYEGNRIEVVTKFDSEIEKVGEIADRLPAENKEAV